MSHDIVIVGSDQVWNPIHKTSDFFLLKDFPDKIKKIAYAASLGGGILPQSRRWLYSKCLSSFSAISLREASGVDIVQSMGINSELVCDPTLLHTREEWCKLLGFSPDIKEKRELMMYFVTPDYRSLWRDAIRIARESGKKVHAYAFVWSQYTDCSWFPLRKGIKRCLVNCYIRLKLFLAGVRLHFSADPTDFVNRLASCEGVITDSFHGLMFATIFGKKCNLVIGNHSERQQMSARLLDFANCFGNREIITEKMDLSALRRLEINDNLKELIQKSKIWLSNTLKEEE